MSRRHRSGSAGLFGFALAAAGCGPPASLGPLPPPKIGKPPKVASASDYQIGPTRFGLESREAIEEPEVRVETPAAGAKFGPRDPIECAVVLRIKSEASRPSMVFADVRDATGSYGRMPLKLAEEPAGGTYRLEGRLTAPGKKGRYRLDAEAEYTIIDRATGKAEVLRFRSPSLSVEVE